MIQKAADSSNLVYEASEREYNPDAAFALGKQEPLLREGSGGARLVASLQLWKTFQERSLIKICILNFHGKLLFYALITSSMSALST